MADPYATRTPDLSGRPTGPPPWEEGVTRHGGALIGPDGVLTGAGFHAVHCRGMGTLAPFVRVEPECGVLLWLEHVAKSPTADQANRLLAALRKSPAPLYATKQGCVGGPSDRPGCFGVEPELVDAVLDACASGSLDWERDPDFGYDVPGVMPGLDPESARALLPRLLYADHDRVYEHAKLVAAKKRERSEMARTVSGLDPAVADAAGWPPTPSGSDWRS